MFRLQAARPPSVGVVAFLFSVLCLLCVGCGSSEIGPPKDALSVMRRDAVASTDGEVLGRWLLGEMVAPGGEASKAQDARKRLDALSPRSAGMWASLGRAIDDEVHGRFRASAYAYIDVIRAAHGSTEPEAPLVAWYATNHVLALRTSVPGLWEEARNVVTPMLSQPGRLGWRARADLVEWWAVDELDRKRGGDVSDGRSSIEISADQYGCAKNVAMAGPFGRGAPTDETQAFSAEEPGPWPPRFERDPSRITAPHKLKVRRSGCTVHADEPVQGGIFYAETYIDLSAERDVIVAVQGALSVIVDDVEVVRRDSSMWGIWPRFGVRLRLADGRHRILARVAGPETSIRLLRTDGTPLNVSTSSDASPGYSVAPPGVLEDPNVLEPFMVASGVAPSGDRRLVRNYKIGPIHRFIAANLAEIEGQADLASVLMEPLVSAPDKATGPSLSAQAGYFDGDPIFPSGDARDLAADFRRRAAKKDEKLWWPKLWLALDAADKRGLPEVVDEVAQLAVEFEQVPDATKALLRIYASLGWKVQHVTTVRAAAKRFPDDVEILSALHTTQEQDGEIVGAKETLARIQELDPDSELPFQQALQRQDYQAAIKELERLSHGRGDEALLARRRDNLRVRAGAQDDASRRLKKLLEEDPENATARLEFADAKFAAGDKAALRTSLVDALHLGADTAPLRDAIELVEGVSELTPYREDGLAVIRDYEKQSTGTDPAASQGGAGNASRVLDYAVMWIYEDGSARMLEHEIIALESREAIAEHAEQEVPRALMLKLRTVKKDGTILEPEFVQGKPTVTMPHLEVGDYIETEFVYSMAGDGQGGRRFRGPRWFFREEKLSYWRSEFVAVSPKNRTLDVETTGAVPPPVVTEDGALVIRHWRVDQSPALPEEPASAPIQEFLPSVRIGWGITLSDTITQLIDATAEVTPKDPRLVRIAEAMVAGTASPSGKAALTGALDDAGRKKAVSRLSDDEIARRLYRWVVANVDEGEETDGRRVIVGKSGNRTRAFLYLCRLLGLDAQLAVVRNRLQPPAIGPISEAESFSAVAVRLTRKDQAPRWLAVSEKFAPYGYMPSGMRGQPAILLKSGAPKVVTSADGVNDGVTHRGTIELRLDGSAEISLEQRYEGKLAISLRSALESLPEARLKDTIESQLLPQALPGARLRDVKVKNLADLDEPLILSMEIEHTGFARPRGAGELSLTAPFKMNIANLAALPERQTPLFISERAATRVVVDLTVELPKGVKVTSDLRPIESQNDGRVVLVQDEVDKSGRLHLKRTIEIPAGRIAPSEYRAFVEFATRADGALHRPIVIAVP